MKSKYISVFMLIALFHFVLSNTFAQDNYFILNGKIAERFNDKPIMLFTFKNDTVFTVDTLIVRNQEFTFRGKEYLEDQSIVVTGNYPEEVVATCVILEKGIISVDLNNATSDPNFFIAHGTFLNDEMKARTDTLRRIGERWNNVQTQFNEGLISEIIKDSILGRITGERIKMNADFKKRNIDNLVGKILFKQGLSSINDPYFEGIYNMAGKELKSDPQVVKHIKEREEWKRLNEKRSENIGKQYADFELESAQGPTKISNYVGNSDILLIDFWASWCGPCIAEFSHLKKLHEQYDRNELSILSISIDKNRTNWVASLSKHNLPWVQLLVTENVERKIMEAYNIKAIPYMVLVDRDGKIIAANLRGSKLESFINRYLQKQ